MGAERKQREQPEWAVDRRKVVMGVAVGYGIEEFRRFVGSLRATGFMGAVVLGVGERDNLSPVAREYLQRHRVETRVVRDGTFTPNMQGEDGNHAGFYNVAVPRWLLYRDWMREAVFDVGNTVDGTATAAVAASHVQFLLTDTRDVYFQRDPFADLAHGMAEGHEILLFQEWSNRTLGNCPHNNDWIRSCWGNRVATELAHHPVICSGTVMGSRRGLEGLIAALQGEVKRVRAFRAAGHPDIPPVSSAKHGRPCVNDQSYVNVIMRRNSTVADPLLASAKVFAQGYGPVNTIGWVAVKSQVKRDADGFVLNADGRRSAVVHQYDRAPDIKKWVDAKFVDVIDLVGAEGWAAAATYAQALQRALTQLP
jgi:hypothetical protein